MLEVSPLPVPISVVELKIDSVVKIKTEVDVLFRAVGMELLSRLSVASETMIESEIVEAGNADLVTLPKVELRSEVPDWPADKEIEVLDKPDVVLDSEVVSGLEEEVVENE